MTEQAENKKPNGVKKNLSDFQRIALDPLGKKTQEKQAQITQQMKEIQASHGKVMRVVRNKFMGDALYFVDKG